MNRSLTIALVLAFVGFVVLSNTLYVVGQREQAIVLSFGGPVRVVNAVGHDEPGLHMKAPFVENVVKVDKRNLPLIADKEEIIDVNQKRLVVDAFVRYRIANPLQYYRTLRNETIAQDRIERLVNSSLRQILGSATTEQIVSSQRGALMAATLADVAKRARTSDLGVEIIDVRIKRADLPQGNQEAVFRRMRTSREQDAAQIRAGGEQQKRQIIAEANKEVAITLATATEEAENVRGQGDGLRTRIFAQSFGKDPSFAAFYRSMQAYEASLGQGDTTMVLSPDSAFFKYFERGPGAK
ncbi:protease modulator HflC [Phenylobacterium aquaticum]|uniref:protease modulator HflC n=1 Tax=Phenylobacterium aquaticum TaxID=1763816 RepID=UPI0026F37C3A|nr:protease modulator HflC [Phenylobacterium aquaticum]